MNRRPRRTERLDKDTWIFWNHEESPYEGFGRIIYLDFLDEYFVDYELGWYVLKDPEHYESFERAYEQCDLMMQSVEQNHMLVD